MERVQAGKVPGPEVSVRLHDNDFLESLTHVHPATPWVLGVPVIAWMVWLARVPGGMPLPHLVGFIATGALLWTLLEYLMHRFVFHYEPKSSWGKTLHFHLHGVHHAYPNDPTRLVMPPALSIPLGLFTYMIIWSLVGLPYAPAVFAGVLCGYIAYDTMHYVSHHSRVRTPLGRAIKRNHMRHHFSDPRTGYGVSSPLWDLVFGTRKLRR